MIIIYTDINISYVMLPELSCLNDSLTGYYKKAAIREKTR